VSEKAFQLIENRDKIGLTRFLDQNAAVPLVDLIDNKGFTLMHQACFKNLEEIASKLMDRAVDTVTDS
jgi:ankyrin repeat protein